MAVASRVRMQPLGTGGFHVVVNTNGITGEATGTFKLLNSSNTLVLRESAITISNQANSVNELLLERVAVYPNPAVAGAQITLSDAPTDYTLYSLTGKVVAQGFSNQIQAPSVPGIYVLNIKGAQQRIVVTP